MAPIMLHRHMTQRKVRKASWQPGLGHFPGTTVAFSGGTLVRQVQPVRFWGQGEGGVRGGNPTWGCWEVGYRGVGVQGCLSQEINNGGYSVHPRVWLGDPWVALLSCCPAAWLGP